MALGSTQNLSDGGAQVLQALAKSLSPEILGSTRDGNKLTPEQARKLSDKLSELLGDNEPATGEQGGVNEDGLPIIEITEPLPSADSSEPNERTPALTEPDLVPLNSLTPSERHRRRVQRDRILDFLEEEERKEQLRTEKLEQEERQESVRKRKAALSFEIEKLKATKDLHKKMGKALLTSLANDREREEKVQGEIPARDAKESLPKKKVTFAEEPEKQIDWGDVTPATLGPMNRNSLISKARLEKHQVMRDVVERLPPGAVESQQYQTNEADSDDESNPDHPLPSNPDEDEDVLTTNDSEDDGSNSIEDENLESPESEEEYDMDTARHQREIALEYIKKRGIVGKDMATVLTSHAQSEMQNEWDQPEVPLDATLSSPPPKPPMSRFKADRIASTSLSSLISSSTASESLRGAIRTGKLEGDRLVCADDSNSENGDEAVKEVLDSLRKGSEHGAVADTPTDQIRSRPSQFKQSRQSRPMVSSSNSPSSSTVVERHPPSSTKLQFKPRSIPRTTKRSISNESRTKGPDPRESLPSGSEPIPLVQFPTIIESPSFFPAGVSESSRRTNNAGPASTTGRPDRPPEVLSSVVRESRENTSHKVPQASEYGSGRRVSRFKAERS